MNPRRIFVTTAYLCLWATCINCKQNARIHFDDSKVKSISNADGSGGRSYGRQPYSAIENNRYRPVQPLTVIASIAQTNFSSGTAAEAGKSSTSFYATTSKGSKSAIETTLKPTGSIGNMKGSLTANQNLTSVITMTKEYAINGTSTGTTAVSQLLLEEKCLSSCAEQLATTTIGRTVISHMDKEVDTKILRKTAKDDGLDNVQNATVVGGTFNETERWTETASLSKVPSRIITALPSQQPNTKSPTSSEQITYSPSKSPSADPSRVSSARPFTLSPTSTATATVTAASPTNSPTNTPTAESPTTIPSKAPSASPSIPPSTLITTQPSITKSLTSSPSKSPTSIPPTKSPTASSSHSPTHPGDTDTPTATPSTKPPTASPTNSPTNTPPTKSPTLTSIPTTKTPTITSIPTTESPTASNPNVNPDATTTARPSKAFTTSTFSTGADSIINTDADLISGKLPITGRHRSPRSKITDTVSSTQLSVVDIPVVKMSTTPRHPTTSLIDDNMASVPSMIEGWHRSPITKITYTSTQLSVADIHTAMINTTQILQSATSKIDSKIVSVLDKKLKRQSKNKKHGYDIIGD